MLIDATKHTNPQSLSVYCLVHNLIRPTLFENKSKYTQIPILVFTLKFYRQTGIVIECTHHSTLNLTNVKRKHIKNFNMSTATVHKSVIFLWVLICFCFSSVKTYCKILLLERAFVLTYSEYIAFTVTVFFVVRHATNWHKHPAFCVNVSRQLAKFCRFCDTNAMHACIFRINFILSNTALIILFYYVKCVRRPYLFHSIRCCCFDFLQPESSRWYLHRMVNVMWLVTMNVLWHTLCLLCVLI